MCGICGIVSRKGLVRDEVERLAAVNRALAHRGPDGAGAYQDSHAALMMRRLSIVDLEGG